MSRGLSTEIKARIAAGTVRPVYLAYFDFVGYTLRTWTGEGDLAYDSQTWNGNGYLQSIPSVSESGDLVPQSVSFQLTGMPDTAVDLADPANYQGRAVELYVGFFDADGTLPATNVYKLFGGKISTVGFSSDATDEEWTVNAESRLIDLQRIKSARWTHEEQRARYAADNGLAYAVQARTAVALFRDMDVPPPASRKIIYGQRRVMGDIVFAGTSGSSSKYLNLVIAVADHECQSIEQVFIDDKALLSAGVVAGEFVGFVSYYEQLGTDAQAYISELETEVGTAIWDSDCRLRGVCYIYLRLTSSDDVFGDTLPTIEVEVKGKKLYDPRDSSTNYSTNPALALRDYLLAVSGFGAAAAEVDDSAIGAAATICAQSVSKADGSSEARYQVSGIINTAVTIGSNLDKILQTMDGLLVYAEGEFVLTAGTYVAPALTITEADLLDEEAVSNSSRREWSNGAKGTYINAAAGWSEEDYPPYSNATHVSTDGEARNISLTLPLTTSPAAAQRLAKIAVNHSRRSRGFSLLCNVSVFDALTGDVVLLTLDRLGYTAKTFRVQSLRLEPVGLAIGVRLELLEFLSDHYDWDETTEEQSLQTFNDPSDVLYNWVNAKLAPPSATPGNQSFSSTFNVTVSHNESGVTCHYTLDGSEPTEADSSVADAGTISIVHDNTDKVLKIKTFENAGDLISDVVTYNYTAILTAPAATATFVTGGSYNDDGTVSGAYFNLQWAADSTSNGEVVTLETRDTSGTGAERTFGAQTLWAISERETDWITNTYLTYEARTLATGHLTNTLDQAPRVLPPPLIFRQTAGPHAGALVGGIWKDGNIDTINYRKRSRTDSTGSTWGAWGSWSAAQFMHTSVSPPDGHPTASHDLYSSSVDIIGISQNPGNDLLLESGGQVHNYEVRYQTGGGSYISDSASIEGIES
tara:strand:- start:1331 stop:4099 length:2769 start_codon:yes stop_codon:yes gene_type:complete